jgi:hypothetical protein
VTPARCALWVAAVGLAACGSDEPAGPTGRDLRGTWAYSASGISPGPPPFCAVNGTTITVSTHAGTGFGGTYNLGLLTCNGGGVNDTFAIGMGPVVSGVLTGDSVRFNFDDATWRHVGRISGDTMSGFLNVSLVLGGTPTVATGNWRAVRQ